MNKKIILITLTAVILLTGCSNQGDYSKDQIKELSLCLSEKGVKMYGAFWCGHCKNTKKEFGKSFKNIDYIECDPKCKPDEKGNILGVCKGYIGKPEVCVEKEINGFPSWIFSNGERIEGEASFEELDKKSGCNLLNQVE